MNIITNALDELKKELEQGDDIVTEFTAQGKAVKHSVVVGKHRIAFMKKIQAAIGNKEMTAQEGTKILNEFGRKTTKLYWR